MKTIITITREDLGIGAENIKSLLEKFAPLQGSNEHDYVEVSLNFEKDDTNELSIAIVWQLLREYSKLPCGKLLKYQGGTESFFNERHFFDMLTGTKSSFFSKNIPIHFQTFAPIRPTKDKPQDSEIEQIVSDATKAILNPSNPLHQEIKVQIIECISNAFDHSVSEVGKPAGVLCSLKPDGVLDFCVVDMGQGIKNSFLANPSIKKQFENLPDWELAYMATEKGISCNPQQLRNPGYLYSNGGIGLYFLREFIKNHRDGKMVVISGKGHTYFENGRNSRKTSNLDIKWPGMIVFFRVNINQPINPKYQKLAGTLIEEFDKRLIKL